MYRQCNLLLIVQVINKEKTTMVWPCHDEKDTVNAEGCDKVKAGGKETLRKTKVARQHR